MHMENAIRLVWFVFVGWWLGAFMFGVGLFLTLTIIGAPLGYLLMKGSISWATLDFD